MKVFLGKHKNWIGPYQLADLLQYVGVNEDRCERIGDYLADTWFNSFLQWVDKHRNRIMYVKIDDYDCWSAYHTIALIAKPIIERLRVTKQGTPAMVFDDEYMSIINGKEFHQEEDDGPLHKRVEELEKEAEKRWDDILLAMIYSFDQIIKEGHSKGSDQPNIENYVTFTGKGLSCEFSSEEAHQAYNKAANEYADKIQYGLDMFGKHFQSLWD